MEQNFSPLISSNDCKFNSKNTSNEIKISETQSNSNNSNNLSHEPLMIQNQTSTSPSIIEEKQILNNSESSKNQEASSNQQEIKENQISKPFNFANKPSVNQNLPNGWKKCDVVTNFLRVNFNQSNKKVWEYAIIIKSATFNEDDQKKKCVRELMPLLKEKFSPFKLSGYTFFSMAQLERSISHTVEICEEKIEVQIVNTGHFIDLGNVDHKNIKFNNDVKSFFEKIIKQIIMSNKRMLKMKDNYFDLSNMKPMEEKSFLISGFSTGFRNCDSGFLLLINIKNKFLNGKNCLEKLNEIRNKFLNGGDFQAEAKSYFQGITVMTTYGVPRTYKLSGVNFDKNLINTTFKIKKTGEEISLMNYYSKSYPDIRIKSPNQPLLIVEKKISDESVEQIFVVPELCNLTGMEDNSIELKTKMTSRTKLRPTDKMRQIEGFLNLIHNKEKKKKKFGDETRELNSPNDVKENWGISFNGFKQTQARQIPSPTVNFGKSKLFFLFFPFI